MIEFKLKTNENGNVDFIYSVGEGRFGGSEMSLPQATAICAKANAEDKLVKSVEFIADGFNIKVDEEPVRYFFGNVVEHKGNKK